VWEILDYYKFTELKGCITCKHFPGPYLKDDALKSPPECYECWDSFDDCFVKYERKKGFEEIT
jgi:hypothetical protein